MAYDNPIPGFQTNNTINLRLWAAKPDREFDLQAFNTGDYVQVHPSHACSCQMSGCKNGGAASRPQLFCVAASGSRTEVRSWHPREANPAITAARPQDQ